MVTYYTIFSVPAMSSFCCAVVTVIIMKHCSTAHVKQLALDKKWEGFSSQLNSTAIMASERRAE
jgi:hypothetical protein